MKLIDANVILRYLLNDHEEMSNEARKVVAEGASSTVEVLAEVVYVLTGVYKVERAEVSEALRLFLDEIEIANKPSILYALRAFQETSLDFVDCVLLGYNRIRGQSIYTFDKKLRRLFEEK